MSTSSRRIRLTVVCALSAATIAALIVGCQTYDFEPVQPLAIAQKTKTTTITAHNLKPDLMLLVDKSGSMDYPTDNSNTNCDLPDGGLCGYDSANPCNPATCPTRWSDLKSAMGQFLTNSGTVARMGLALFPGDNSCGATSTVSVALNGSADDNSSMQTTADSINSTIAGTTPGGGTPTSTSLTFLSSKVTAANDSGRQKFVLLLTDGTPNCNSANPNTTQNPSACQCTESATICSLTSDPIEHQVCLDQDATVNEIATLKTSGISTIVVGFGADTAGAGAGPVLTAMANAGGFPCLLADGGSCPTPYYQASNGAELASALARIAGQLIVGDPCIFGLEQAPSDPSLLSVLINGTETPSGPDTWVYDSTTTPVSVHFQGALCTELQSSTPANPVTVEVRVVQAL